jgi:hypothetical protein
MRRHQITKALEVKDTRTKKLTWQLTSTIFLIFFIAEPIAISWWYLF